MNEVVEVSQDVYDSINPQLSFFLHARFNEHYHLKVDSVVHFLLKANNFCVGISGGVKHNTFYSPFSAPYGGFSLFSKDYSHQKMIENLKIWEELLHIKNINQIKITQCPDYISPNFNNYLHNAFKAMDYSLDEIALNQHIDLNKINENGFHFKKSAKNKFNQFLKFDFKFENNGDLAYEAYDLIKKSRVHRNRPLNMTFEELEYAGKINPLEIFVLRLGNLAISACIGVKLTSKIFHVIYWGHDVEQEHLFPMNALAFYLCLHLKNNHFEFVDLGISTDITTPDYGLLSFKSSIGAETGMRLSWSKRI
ncbi:MAG: hypothetical protein SNJ77_07790 [Cytophagales bacterium]